MNVLTKTVKNGKRCSHELAPFSFKEMYLVMDVPNMFIINIISEMIAMNLV